MFKIVTEAEADEVFKDIVKSYCFYTRRWSGDEEREFKFLYDYYDDFQICSKDNLISCLDAYKQPVFAKQLDQKDIVKLSVRKIGDKKNFTIDSASEDYAILHLGVKYCKKAPLTKKQAKYFNTLAKKVGIDLQREDNTRSPYKLAVKYMKEGKPVEAAKVFSKSGSLLERNLLWILSRCDNTEFDQVVELIKADNPIEGMKVTLVGNILFKGGTFNLGNYNTVSPSLQVDGKIMTAGTNDRVRFKKITGKIDYQIYPMTIIMDMSELMSSLNSETLTTSLDLNRMSLKLDVEAEISIASFKGDVAGSPITCNPVRLNCPEVSGESALTRLWLSNTSEGKPEGYRFVDVDLVSLLKDMPDRIEFTIDAATDSKENSELVPSVKYILKSDYEMGLPIEFGEDFGIQFSERIDDIPQEVGVFLEGGSLALAGEITNSLPLQLEMKVSLLDSKGKSIQFADDAGFQVIKSCGADGTPCKSDISLMLKAKPGEDLSDISSLKLDFKATAKDAAGVPVTKDSFMQVTLYARVPEGITVDLNRYVEIEDDDE